MKNYDLSERKLKIGVALAMAIICWWCLRSGASSHAQTNRGFVSHEFHDGERPDDHRF
jgi:hypothetical protein